MIDRTIRIEHLDPETWNNAGIIYEALARYRETAYVLLRGGVVSGIADSRSNEYPRESFDPGRPEESAAAFFGANAGVDRLIVLEESAWTAFYVNAQSWDGRTLDSDEFCERLNSSFDAQPGIRSFYRSGKKRSALAKLKELAAEKLPPDCHVFLRVMDRGADLFHCIAGFSGGKVRSLTTLDCLGEDVKALLASDDRELDARLRGKFPGTLKTYRFELGELREFAARD